MKKLLLLIFICGLAACSNPLSKMSILSATMPQFEGTTAMTGSMRVKNDNRQQFRVEKATIKVFFKGKTLATAHLVGPIAIPAQKTSFIAYSLELEGVTRKNIQTLALAALTASNQITLDIEARVGMGRLHKKVNIKQMPVSNFISNFGR